MYTGPGRSTAARTALAVSQPSAGTMTRHVGQRAQDGDVLGAVVRGAGLPEAHAAVRGDDLDVEVLVADVGAHLLERAHAGERRHGADERQQAALGHAGGDAEQVLLGDADVEEALRELVLEHADLGARARSAVSATMRGSASARSQSTRP